MVKTVLFKRLIVRALNGHGRGLSSACDIRTPDFLTLSYYGVGAIPPDWMERLALRELISEKAGALFDLSTG